MNPPRPTAGASVSPTEKTENGLPSPSSPATLKTSYGPAKSSTSMSSKARMATVRVVAWRHCPGSVGAGWLASHMTTTPTTYRLVRPDVAVDVPTLDEHQQRVVDHPGGPLLVLAGPGTGKTTTLVEAIVDRIEHRGARPDEVLALTFSRKAAEQLRDRVTARLGRTMSTTLSSTFHSFAYALIRRYAPAELYEAPLRLLSAPEQDVVLRELLTDHPESVTLARLADARARHPRLRARGAHRAVPRPREGPRRRRRCGGSARPRGCRSSWPPGSSSTSTSTASTARAPSTTPT